MGFTKTQSELDAFYALGARQFTDARMLAVMFQTAPEVVTRLLPPPLEPADTPTGMMFVAQYPETNLGPGYREAALFLNCSYQGEAGNYCLAMPIESEESRLYNGRDIFGYPKKMARIGLELSDGRAHAWVERHGVRFLEIEATPSVPMPELPKPGPNFLFKASPRIDLQPGFDGPVLLCRQQTDVAMKELMIGPAEVTLRPSAHDPWAELGPIEVIVASLMLSDNTMQPGSVLGEVDGEAYLPYYHKMTDTPVDAVGGGK